MAYMNQERKTKIAVALNPILKKYGIKGTLSVRSHMTIVLTLKSGKIDFGGNNLDINPYWFHEHFTGDAKNFLTEAFAALKSADWYDRSDSRFDYFDTAYYTDINIGKWNKPYELVA
jgi:hypothetical protein